jgi:hypothetical protein
MAVLQHELQHVLDYKIGWLTGWRYVTNPRHWTYDWRLEAVRDWDALGAEQRASIAEHFWRAENDLAPAGDAEALRGVIPWA